MSVATEEALNEFKWEVQPAAARWVTRVIQTMAERNPLVNSLSRVLHDETGTRITDWIDHLAIGDDSFAQSQRDLAEVGYMQDAKANFWRHPEGMFPPVVVEGGRVGIGIRCDSIDDCLAVLPKSLGLARNSTQAAEGQPGGQYRTAEMHSDAGICLWVVERHGHPGFDVPESSSKELAAAPRHLQSFRVRKRACDDMGDGFRDASERIAAAAKEIGTNWACALFFQAEREYWQSRNHAARVQFERQNKLGLGWANHDHHTYRSSRAAFPHLVACLEQLGFHCRERFYAGQEAGWGAQVLEQSDCGIVIFADVDLSPEELAGDFAHDTFKERDELGTVGLWCELHGEAFLQAGMHHLECQFDFDAARQQLAALGIESMAPFTNFPFLRQCFTKGDTWPVDSKRVDRLVASGRITEQQADRFRREGALGSHMEILERNDGYKGFNQTGVSEIIARTDPRKMVSAS